MQLSTIIYIVQFVNKNFRINIVEGNAASRLPKYAQNQNEPFSEANCAADDTS